MTITGWMGGWMGGAAAAAVPVPGALTSGSILESARDRHMTFDAQRHPPSVLLSRLTLYQRVLVGKMLELNPDALTAQAVLVPSAAAFPAGIDLGASAQQVTGASCTFTADPDAQPGYVEVINYEARTRPGKWTRVWYLNGRIYLAGSFNQWKDVGTLTIDFVPVVAGYSALTTALQVPDICADALVADLVVLMAGRGAAKGLLDQSDVRLFTADAERAEAALLQQLTVTRRATRVRIRETM